MTKKRFTYEYDEYDGNLFDNKMNTFYHIEDSDENIEVLCDRLNWLVEENEQLKQKVSFYKYFQKDARELEKENEQLKQIRDAAFELAEKPTQHTLWKFRSFLKEYNSGDNVKMTKKRYTSKVKDGYLYLYDNGDLMFCNIVDLLNQQDKTITTQKYIIDTQDMQLAKVEQAFQVACDETKLTETTEKTLRKIASELGIKLR